MRAVRLVGFVQDGPYLPQGLHRVVAVVWDDQLHSLPGVAEQLFQASEELGYAVACFGADGCGG